MYTQRARGQLCTTQDEHTSHYQLHHQPSHHDSLHVKLTRATYVFKINRGLKRAGISELLRRLPLPTGHIPGGSPLCARATLLRPSLRFNTPRSIRSSGAGWAACETRRPMRTGTIGCDALLSVRRPACLPSHRGSSTPGCVPPSSSPGASAPLDERGGHTPSADACQ